MTAHTYLLIGTLILLVTTASAQGAFEATFNSSTAAWAEAEASGQFAGLVVQPVNFVGENAELDSWFELRGRSMQVETDTADLYLEAAPVTAAPLPPTLPLIGNTGVESTSVEYLDATVTGTASRGSRLLYVFPIPGLAAEVEVPCGVAAHSPDGEFVAVARLNGSRGDFAANTVDALEVRTCFQSALVVTGSFLVVLWEWDAHLMSAQGEVDWWSGKAHQENVPVGADLRPYVSRAQQIYVTVRDGAFTINGNADRPPLLYSESLDLVEAPTIKLDGATGQIKDAGVPVTGANVILAGALEARLKAADRGVQVQVLDGLRTINVNGLPLASIVTAEPTTAGRSAWQLVGMVGAVLAPLVAVPIVRRRRARPAAGITRLVDHVETLIQTGQAEEALRPSQRLLRRVPSEPHAHWLRVSALRRAGYPEQAFAHYQGLTIQGLHFQGRFAAELALEAARAALQASTGFATRQGAWRRLACQALLEACQADKSILADLDVHPGLEALYFEATNRPTGEPHAFSSEQ